MSLVKQFVDIVCDADLKQGISQGIDQAGGLVEYLRAVADVIRRNSPGIEESTAEYLAIAIEEVAFDLLNDLPVDDED